MTSNQKDKLPFDKVSSPIERQWDGFSTHRACHHVRQHDQSPFTEHILGVLLGQPISITRRADGRSDSGICGKNDMQLIPAGQTALYEFGGAVDAYHLRFSPAFLHRIAEENELSLVNPDLQSIFRFRNVYIEPICGALLTEEEQGYPNSSLFVGELAMTLAVLLLNEYAATGRRATREIKGRLSAPDLRCVLDYMEENLANDARLSDIAGEIALSTYHFARLFRRTVGIPPHQYMIERRVERAKILLQGGTHTVTTAALAVGFADHSHLHRHCKRILGLAPSDLIAVK